MKSSSKIKINGGEYMKARIKFLLITGVFSLLVSCTGKEKVQQPMSDEYLNLILSKSPIMVQLDHFSTAVCLQEVAEPGPETRELYWGLFYFMGVGVDRDLSKAAEFLKRALKHSYSDTPEKTGKFFGELFFKLGNAYNDGEGVKKKKRKLSSGTGWLQNVVCRLHNLPSAFVMQMEKE
jgi:hypothetical protein